MQNEREKHAGRFFVLIQKLNFIFVDESFNEMNTERYILLHLQSRQSRNERVAFILVIRQTACTGTHQSRCMC